MNSFVGKLRLALTNPVAVLREVNCVFNQRFYLRDYYPGGVDVFEEDWDNLVILDSCRYDMFSEHSTLPGKLERRVSRGTGTREFLRGNFHGRSLRDTVYVTANPQLYWHSDEFDVDLHAVVDVWRDGWDEEFGTVLPETTTEYAMMAAGTYPDKRLVVHYLQPHRPFIGNTGRRSTELPKQKHPEKPQLQDELFSLRADFSREEYWEAFTENLRIVLPYVEELLGELQGKTVVTSDHGQLVGERSYPIPFRDYGHWRGNYARELLEVPWLEYTNGERKKVVESEPNEELEEPDNEEVKGRLRQLGYTY